MGAPRPCRLCDRPLPWDRVQFCDVCRVHARGFIALGHAIRRFVRVYEVERLTVAARARMMRHDHACNVRQPGDGCVADTGHAALDRLAAMAMGGEP